MLFLSLIHLLMALSIMISQSVRDVKDTQKGTLRAVS